MDSERRHELETNDLREFLDNFKDFWDKHGNKVLIVLIVVLGSFAAYNYYNRWSQGKLEDANEALDGATSPTALLAVAEEHSRAYDEAMRRAGDLYLADAREASIKDDPKALKSALDKAASAYTALTTRSQTTEYQLAGHEGLAMVAIEAKEWDKAKDQFKKMKDLAGDRYPAQAQRAEAGPQMVDLVRNQVAFAPDDDLSFNPDDTPKPDGDDQPKPQDNSPDDTGNTPLLPIEPVLPEIQVPGTEPSTPPTDPGN